jgi:hypothetical protein
VISPSQKCLVFQSFFASGFLTKTLYSTWHFTLEGPCIIFCNIYTFRDTQCCSTDCLLMHKCQLYMFRTVMVHPQELLFSCCMCRLWYVIRTALSDTSRWYNVWVLPVYGQGYRLWSSSLCSLKPPVTCSLVVIFTLNTNSQTNWTY